MKRQIEGFTVYSLTNEFQVYDGMTLRCRVWKCGVGTIDLERLMIVLSDLI